MIRLLLGLAGGAVLLAAGTITCLLIVIDDLERANVDFWDDDNECCR